jgi:two-component system chemotaxis sensor kinase CheA
MDELLEQFLIESRDLIAQAQEDLAVLEHAPDDRARIDSAFRAVHTLKGSVAVFNLEPALKVLHAAEDVLDKARSGSTALDPERIAALVDCLDQNDRWVDFMEERGALPAEAGSDAALIIARLLDVSGMEPAAVAAVAGWAVALATELDDEQGQGGAVIVFRYEPDPDCFFRGDDPLAIVAAIPELSALKLEQCAPWPALADMDPFRCNIRLAGLSRAPLADVKNAFRLVADQVEIRAVERRAVDIERSGGNSAGNAAAVLRVDAARVDALADGVGELIVASNALSQVAARADRIDIGLAAQIRVLQGNFARVVDDMHRSILAVRTVSIAPTLRRLPRMVREIAAATGRDVQLKMTGEATEIDKRVADELFEPILHLVRNAIDHGIEPPEDRAAAGKSRQGVINLDVKRSGDQVLIVLADDGKGIDPGLIRRIAVERGVVDGETAADLDDAAALRLIFAAGFSTVTTVSDISGRGVGMDAVQAAIDRVGGRIEVASRPGKGTEVTLLIPLHAITTKLLIVEVGGDRFGVPLNHIVETSSIDQNAIFPIGRGKACVHRDRTLPLLSLARLLDQQIDETAQESKLLVMGSGPDAVGVMVSGLQERVDAMVRPPRGLLAGVPGIAGTTLLGNGGVLIVLDLPELVA